MVRETKRYRGREGNNSEGDRGPGEMRRGRNRDRINARVDTEACA